MYRVGIQRTFTARHFLVGGDFGDKCKLHGHDYRLEVTAEGPRLGEHDFLLDITVLAEPVDALVRRYANSTLNEFEEFAGVNPSMERLAGVIAERVAAAVRRDGAAPEVAAITATVWEDPTAWASRRIELTATGRPSP